MLESDFEDVTFLLNLRNKIEKSISNCNYTLARSKPGRNLTEQRLDLNKSRRVMLTPDGDSCNTIYLEECYIVGQVIAATKILLQDQLDNVNLKLEKLGVTLTGVEQEEQTVLAEDLPF
jgi:hypothetical protein